MFRSGFFHDFLQFLSSPVSLSLFLWIHWRAFLFLSIVGLLWTSYNFNDFCQYFHLFSCSFSSFLSFYAALFLSSYANAYSSGWHFWPLTFAKFFPGIPWWLWIFSKAFLHVVVLSVPFCSFFVLSEGNS